MPHILNSLGVFNYYKQINIIFCPMVCGVFGFLWKFKVFTSVGYSQQYYGGFYGIIFGYFIRSFRKSLFDYCLLHLVSFMINSHVQCT